MSMWTWVGVRAQLLTPIAAHTSEGQGWAHIQLNAGCDQRGVRQLSEAAAPAANGPPQSQAVLTSGPSQSLTSAGTVLRKGNGGTEPIRPDQRRLAPRKSENQKEPDLARSWADPWSVRSTPSSRHLLCIPSPSAEVNIKAFAWHCILYFAKSFLSYFPFHPPSAPWGRQGWHYYPLY